MATYRGYVQSLEPLVYIDFTDSPTENLGTLGGTLTSSGGMGARTITTHGHFKTDSKGVAVQSGSGLTYTVSTPIGRSLRSSSFTIAYWAEPAANAGYASYPFSLVGRVRMHHSLSSYQTTNRLGRYTPTGSEFTHTLSPPSNSGRAAHYVIRYINDGETGTFEYWRDGILRNTIGPSADYAQVGVESAEDTFTATMSSDSNRRIQAGEVSLWDRALTDDEIRSLSIDYNEDWETIDIETDATVADATAEMPNADVEAIWNPPNRNIKPAPAVATAMTVQPQLRADAVMDADSASGAGLLQHPSVLRSGVRERSPEVVIGHITSPDQLINTGQTLGVTGSAAANFYFKLPVPGPGEEITSTRFRTRPRLANDARVDYYVADGPLDDSASSPFYSVDRDQPLTITIDIPGGAKWIRVRLAGRWSYQSTMGNPSEGGDNATYFLTDYALRALTLFPAEPFTANAEMLNATGSAVTGVSVGALAATATAQMLDGVVPDANTRANLMTGAALMGAAWFKSDRNVAVDVFDGTAEALDIADVDVTSNIFVNPAVALMTDGEIIDPEEVDYTTSDPYWNRVVGNRDVGQNVLRGGGIWLRFNERRGDPYATSTTSGARSANPEGVLTGAYRWGATAPNGKRGLRVDNAGLDASRNDTWPFSGSTGSSYEFTIKVAPGHTGRMDLFNGSMQQPSGVGPTVTHRSHVSIRDGRIYIESRKYGTSMSRIDDNKWHHIVLTPRPAPAGYRFVSDNLWPLDIYIDGKLDRTLIYNENEARLGTGDPRAMVRPDHYFGQDTGFPFRGEIVDFVFRWTTLNSNQVMELFLDMFGNEAVRPGIADATAEMRDGKVESNMKRMLVLSFGSHTRDAQRYDGTRTQPNNEAFGILVSEDKPVAYTPIMEHGFGKGTDVGNYRLSYQNVAHGGGDVSPSAEHLGHGGSFRDSRTGLPRLINLQEDVNLDDFDVIFVQGYRNPSLNDQATRLRYEAFLNSLNQALVDGHKLWITDPYLAHDLGWITDTEVVPVTRQGNDVRAVDVVPKPEAHGIHQQPYPRPADGSMPVLPKGLPMGSTWGLQNIWRWDLHHNNGYRVVNEIDGLTTLPSWETVDHFVRDKTQMFDLNPAEAHTYGYRLENRTGEDFEWVYEKEQDEYKMVKPATGLGLRAGDEFYDWTWTHHGINYLNHMNEHLRAAYSSGVMRAGRTWAVPPGALKVGTPITTFRSTLHDDFGREVPNPYRNHVRNAVVRPGDSLPDGRKVKGYVYMDFAMSPELKSLAGYGVEKQLTMSPGVDAGGRMEDEYSFDWDYFELGGRVLFDQRGNINMVGYIYRPIIGGAFVKQKYTATWPLAMTRTEFYQLERVPHLPWQSRGLAWLLTVDKVDTEFATYSPQAATATAGMGTVQVGTEFETEVNVGPARAVANIMAPAEAQVRNASVTAWAATATGRMTGLMGGYSAEPAQAFASMPENVQRPQDIEEVLFFTLTMSQETITLRMEEN